MNNTKLTIIFIGMLGAALLSTTVLAEDIFPPPWRGQPGTTWADWEFLTPNPTPLPEVQFNPYGDSSTVVYPGFSQTWQQEWGGHVGVWPLSGVAFIEIPNSPVPNPYKDIWVQVTWAAQVPGPGGQPYVSEEYSGLTGSLINQIALGPTNAQPSPPLGDTWYQSVYQIRIQPNPPHEKIVIGGSIMLDELVIDTYCVPEPATLIMFAAAIASALFAGAIRRSRR
jgi:hypothetical protein